MTDMEHVNYPLVSIGLPVFNGEESLDQTLDALLNQDYTNLEIIISDNGSTDRTSEICEEFLKKNSRVKYYRSSENLGSNWNFNRVVDLSSGKYFMWAAEGDLHELSFVRACVEKLEQFPEAVLCHVHTAFFIENRKERLCISNLDSFAGVTGLVERYRETLKNFPAVAIYGVYRSAAMKKTHMMEQSVATDLAFIAELSIYGSFVQVPELLFSYIGREKWNTVHDDYIDFSGKGRKPWWYLPFVVLFCDQWSRVTRAELTFGLKLRLWTLLIDHEVRQIILKVLIKVCRRICPAAIKERLASAIYSRWMQGPNLEIDCEDLFLERIIKPRIGWWR
ncbi:glycosyltransferase family 2 protein [Gammaproteobacteria bacterium]|nr:glycosyltransferase family 2 protein [Gammaproteobacteria bacterium]